MKKISIILLALVTIIGFNACTDDDQLIFTAQPDPEGVSFVNSFSPQYVLTAETMDNLAERFVWESPDFGVDTPVTYELLGSPQATFDTSSIIGSTTENNLPITVAQLMSLAGDAGLDNDPDTVTVDENGDPVLDADGNPVPNNFGEVYVRLRASIGTQGSEEILSEIKPIVISLPEPTGEEPIVLLRELFFVGNATAADWNNDNNNTPMVRDPENENSYTFTGYFVANEFKLLETKGQWQPQWGLDGGAFISSDILGGDPGSFVVPADGYYTLTVSVDPDNLSSSFDPFDESASVTYPTIGFIGDATPNGWDSDTDLTQSTFDPHVWYATGVELVVGEMKFRAQDDWAVNWGANTELTGFATQDGPNIPVSTAGIYDIWFNDIDASYVLIPIVE